MADVPDEGIRGTSRGPRRPRGTLCGTVRFQWVRRRKHLGRVTVCVSISFATLATCTTDDRVPPPIPQEQYVVAAVGDIACGNPSDHPADAGDACRDHLVAELVRTIDPDRLLLLGDIQYPSDDDVVSYERHFDRSFGRLRSISSPTRVTRSGTVIPASTSRTSATSRGPPHGYYSFELGAWHVLSLNSPDCLDADGCGLGHPAIRMAARRPRGTSAGSLSCTLAFWHDPRFLWVSWWQQDGRPRGPQPHVRPLWGLLQDWDAEVVLGGNAHNYERWLPQDAAGIADAEGLTQFVVGTGGRRLNEAGPEPRPAQLAAFQDDAFEHSGSRSVRVSISWSWRSAAGEPPFQDEGTAACH